MWAPLVKWLFSIKAAKAGAGVVSGGGLILMAVNMNSATSARLERRIDLQREYVREHVALSIKPIEVNIENIKMNQGETNKMIRDLHNHLINKP